MNADITPLLVGLLILISSLLSLRLGLSVAILEIVAGAIAGNLGMEPKEWMLYLANFGGVLLTFLAGTEIDTRLFREKFAASFGIGALSFILPFAGIFLFSFYVFDWNQGASLIAGVALSTTSLAVVYSVLVETGLSKTAIGKLLMAATFVTDMGTALALSILFVKPSIYTAIFIIGSLLVIYIAERFSRWFFENPKLQNKVIEPEIKYIFLLLLAFMYFA